MLANLHLFNMKSDKNPLDYLLRRWQDLTPNGKFPCLAAKSRELPEFSFESPNISLLPQEEISGGRNLTQVPKGCLAVYVGPEMRRFVIPASYLCSPDFRELMDRAADEFGFEQKDGLRIPCEVETFEELLTAVEKASKKKAKKNKV